MLKTLQGQEETEEKKKKVEKYKNGEICGISTGNANC